jgi:hypothetical protein
MSNDVNEIIKNNIDVLEEQVFYNLGVYTTNPQNRYNVFFKSTDLNTHNFIHENLSDILIYLYIRNRAMGYTEGADAILSEFNRIKRLDKLNDLKN